MQVRQIFLELRRNLVKEKPHGLKIIRAARMLACAFGRAVSGATRQSSPATQAVCLNMERGSTCRKEADDNGNDRDPKEQGGEELDADKVADETPDFREHELQQARTS